MTVDLSTEYLGLDLPNPIVVGASPLTADLDGLHSLQEAGAAAVVLPSLFEEQIEHEELELSRMHETGAESTGEAVSYFPETAPGVSGPERYLEHLRRAREELRIPVLASLNGHSTGGWVRHARLLENNGAHAIELNVYFLATDPEQDGPAVEARYLRLVEEVCSRVGIPVAVKIGPFFSSLPNMARRLVDAGAAGLVLFNRFLEPDIDVDTLHVTPTIELSSRAEVRLPLRWIAILRGRLPAFLASTSGAHEPEDVTKLLLAGADVTQVVSCVLRKGPGRVTALLEGLREWLDEKGYASVGQMKGSMCRSFAPDPDAYERANYMRALTSFSTPP